MVCIQAGEELTRETWMEEEDSFCPQVGDQGRQEGVATFQMNRWSKKLLGQVSQQLENWGKIELKFLKLDLQCITLWELNFESCYIHNSPSPQNIKNMAGWQIYTLKSYKLLPHITRVPLSVSISHTSSMTHTPVTTALQSISYRNFNPGSFKEFLPAGNKTHANPNPTLT